MNQIISIIVGVIFAYIVYIGICKKGFLVGYVLNFVGCLVGYFLQEQAPELTIVVIAGILVGVTIVTVVEYIAFQKTQSFIGYLAYVGMIIVATIVVIYLTKALFTFIANPSVLFELKK